MCSGSRSPLASGWAADGQDRRQLRTDNELAARRAAIGVSLVDGDPTVRHARQLMLRSEHYEVRSYVSCAALLADPRSRDFACIVLDIELDDEAGVAILREMRATGWRGHAILLDGLSPDSDVVREAQRNGDRVMERTVGDGSLVAAISASVDCGWAGWNAAG